MSYHVLDDLAPIILFAFNRPDLVRKTLENLIKCDRVSETVLYVFVDGPRFEEELHIVEKVKNTIEEYRSFFRNVVVTSRSKNLGLADSVKTGVSSILNEYDSVIVLEDDLLVSQDFIVFMNSQLNLYKDDNRVGSISGFAPPLDRAAQYDNFFYSRATSWGWGTWRSRWFKVDWDLGTVEGLINRFRLWMLLRVGGNDLFRMLIAQQNGLINSWAIVWVYNHIKKGWLVSYPYVSRVANVGFGVGATHCKNEQYAYKLILKNNEFAKPLLSNVELDKEMSRKVNWYHSYRYKVYLRLKLLFKK